MSNDFRKHRECGGGNGSAGGGWNASAGTCADSDETAEIELTQKVMVQLFGGEQDADMEVVSALAVDQIKVCATFFDFIALERRQQRQKTPCASA
jgi:hypothetical protein